MKTPRFRNYISFALAPRATQLVKSDLRCERSPQISSPHHIGGFIKTLLWGTLTTWMWAISTAHGLAAERVTLQFGPIEQPIAVSDLEKFAETGEISARLRLLAPLLTPDLQRALRSRIQLDPDVSDRLVEDLLLSTAGDRLMETLELAIPDGHPADIQLALNQAAHEPGGLSLLGFLRAFPQDDITLDATSAIALASQLNLPYWQSHVLRSALERDLTLETKPFQAPFDPTAPGYAKVRQQTLTFQDRERYRNIPVDLYWSRWGQGPLVVISHGFGADRRFLSYLAQHLASHGLTVAALEHPGSNVAWLAGITIGSSGSGRLSDILPSTEFVDRPKDISFLLNELERLNRYSSILAGKLDTQHVTVVGHSLGGYTALALAGAKLDIPALRQFCHGRSLVELSPADWLQCTATDLSEDQPSFRDPRVSRIIALNPVMGRIFGESGLTHVAVPSLILSATEDPITPSISQQMLPFAQFQQPDQMLITAIGGTHLSAGDPANLNHALTQSMFLQERRRDETDAMRHMLKGVSLAFAKQTTAEADLYERFLTPDYVQAWSTESIKLRLNDEIPPSLRDWLQMAAGPLEQVVSAPLPKQERKHSDGAFTASVYFLAHTLPLVLFMPPLATPLAVSRFFQRRFTSRKFKSR